MPLFCSDKKLKKQSKNCKYLFGGIVLHSCRSVALLENAGWHAVDQATEHHIQKFMKHFFLIYHTTDSTDYFFNKLTEHRKWSMLNSCESRQSPFLHANKPQYYNLWGR